MPTLEPTFEALRACPEELKVFRLLHHGLAHDPDELASWLRQRTFRRGCSEEKKRAQEKSRALSITYPTTRGLDSQTVDLTGVNIHVVIASTPPQAIGPRSASASS
jgi:hypothetical protein